MSLFTPFSCYNFLRTDNAVKNRFSTLCKRRAKHEALAEENATTYVNLNNRRVVVSHVDTNANGLSETRLPLKKIRKDISDMIERPRQEFIETNEQLTGQKVGILRDLETQASTDMQRGRSKECISERTIQRLLH